MLRESAPLRGERQIRMLRGAVPRPVAPDCRRPWAYLPGRPSRPRP